MDLKKAVGSTTVFGNVTSALCLWKTVDIEDEEKCIKNSHQALWGCVFGTGVRKSLTFLGLSFFICRIKWVGFKGYFRFEEIVVGSVFVWKNILSFYWAWLGTLLRFSLSASNMQRRDQKRKREIQLFSPLFSPYHGIPNQRAVWILSLLTEVCVCVS